MYGQIDGEMGGDNNYRGGRMKGGGGSMDSILARAKGGGVQSLRRALRKRTAKKARKCNVLPRRQ